MHMEKPTLGGERKKQRMDVEGGTEIYRGVVRKSG